VTGPVLFGWFSAWTCGCLALERDHAEVPAACPEHGAGLVVSPSVVWDAPLVIAYGRIHVSRLPALQSPG
jgi:hypothetical protein